MRHCVCEAMIVVVLLSGMGGDPRRLETPSGAPSLAACVVVKHLTRAQRGETVCARTCVGRLANGLERFSPRGTGEARPHTPSCRRQSRCEGDPAALLLRRRILSRLLRLRRCRGVQRAPCGASHPAGESRAHRPTHARGFQRSRYVQVVYTRYLEKGWWHWLANAQRELLQLLARLRPCTARPGTA